MYDLKVGQSALFDVNDLDDMDNFQTRLSSTAYRHGKDHDKKFAVRKIVDDQKNVTHIGVWRTD